MGIYKKIVGSITIIAIGCALLFPIKTMADGVNCMGFHKYKEIDTKYSQKTTTRWHRRICVPRLYNNYYRRYNRKRV